MRTSVPKEFTAGESLAWQKSFSDYPASDGWVLTYYFRGAGPGFEAAASADGDDFNIAVAAEDTSDLTPGRYYYQAFVELDSERVRVDAGEVLVEASLIDESETFDGRSPVKIALDAIDALIAGKATLDQQEYTIGNRQLKRYTPTELIKLREHYAALYAAEQRAENAKKGKSIMKLHKIRFRNPR